MVVVIVAVVEVMVPLMLPMFAALVMGVSMCCSIGGSAYGRKNDVTH